MSKIRRKTNPALSMRGWLLKVEKVNRSQTDLYLTWINVKSTICMSICLCESESTIIFICIYVK